MTRRHQPLALLGLAAALFAASCGAGVAGVVASAGGSSGSVPPAIAAFAVENPKEPDRATLNFNLSKRATVELLYQLPLGAPQRMTQAGPNPRELDAGPQSIPWNFADEPGLAASFADGVLVFARIPGVVDEPRAGENALTLGLGNDAPEIAVEDPPSEVDGVVPIQLRLEDSSGDAVAIRVEFDVEGDALDWQPARPGGLDAKDPTPDPALTGIVAPADPGTELVFFWDTDSDLAELERDVRVRFTPIDPVVAGLTKETGTFRVDNNAAPIVQIFNDLVVTNPDERRGIPIPFRVIDEEGDLVEVIFQWRREGEEFPELPTDLAELDAILADKELRQEHHVCTPYPHYAKGRVVPIDASTVRLPELASSESWILASGIVGRTLELLRPSSIPSPITPTWSSNPLVSPIAALPVGDGLTALVLDAPGTGRLRELELATGAVVREIAALGPGIPSAMVFERREKAVLVALDDAGTWRIERVELASGVLTELILSDGTEPAPVRGIASLGTNALVFTAGSSLFHVDYRDPLAPRLGRLLTDLAAPWGVVFDPLPPNRIYVSERDANRVLAIEIDSHAKLPVFVKAADMQLGTLEAPEALALERHGSRMLIVTSAPGGGRQLLGLDLGATGGNLSFPIGVPTASDVASLAAGSDGLRLASLRAANQILVAGGIEQRRVIAPHSTSSQVVSVELPFSPLPSPGQPWRLAEEAHRSLRASAQGVTRRFVWDSRDASTGLVSLRATAHDDEFGFAVEGAAPKRVRGGLEVEPLTLGGDTITPRPRSVAAADLDGDGDLDLVSANRDGDDLTVFHQLSRGSFAPAFPLGDSTTTRSPRSVVAADLDGDGHLDLVSVNARESPADTAGDDLAVFFQRSGTFDPSPSFMLGGRATTNLPISVAAADLDGDGDLDLVSANVFGDDLTVFFQLAPGSFATDPLRLGGTPRTDGPVAVAAADLDGDGDLDLVSANFAGDDVTVFFQRSAGNFLSAPSRTLGGFPTTDGPSSVAAADLDEDGDLDLVSANSDGHDLTVFTQRSPGSFDPIPSQALGGFPTTNRPISVAAADLDADGDLDLVSANFNGDDLTVFLQVLPGSFTAPPLTLGGSATTVSPASVAAADLDGDGDLDLVSANDVNGGNDLTVFFQASPGSFAAAPLVVGGSGDNHNPASIAAADLDGDGDLDLVLANQDDDNLAVFRQLSPGSFAVAPLTLGDSTTTRSPRSVVAADLDGNGDPDLVSANARQDLADTDGDNLAVFFRLQSGSFDPVPSLVLGDRAATNGPSSVAAADLDADGDLDLVSANFDGDDLTIFSQLSPGSFDPAPSLVLGDCATTDGPASVAAADLDGDGDLDLVSANFDGDDLTVFFQLSPRSFSVTPLGGPTMMDGPRSVAAADLDGDGDLDLVSANSGGPNLTVFFQLSSGTFAVDPRVLGDFPTTDGPISVAAADLDGDGDQDLISANRDSVELTAFFQLSPGSFGTTPLRLGSGGALPTAVLATDLDGDGDQDLVLASSVNSPLGRGNLTVFFGGR